MLRAIIFDYNQVLADDLLAHIIAYKKAFEKNGVKIPTEELRLLMNKTRKEKISYLKQKYGVLAASEEIFLEKTKIFSKIAKEKSFLFPGTEKALEELAKNFELAIFTGTDLGQMHIPKKTLELFKAIVTIEDFSKPKPDPQGLLKCIERLGRKPEECAYVGDSLHDMQAAIAAGCLPIGMASGIFTAEELRKAGAQIIIKEIKELAALKKG